MKFLDRPPRFMFFTGKGGVGKTTLAAAIAVELAMRGLPVHLTTSDPAAHLMEALDGKLEHLTVSRIDPHEVTEQYRAAVLASKGAKLDAAGAYHRDVVRQLGSSGRHFTTPMMQLQDPKQTKVLIVTLAETTPVLEAANLQTDLRRAGIEPWAWVINNSVAAAAVTSPLLQARARNELGEIEAVASRHASRYALVPLLKDEPTGVQRLQLLSQPGA